jgi:hypothetical protein
LIVTGVDLCFFLAFEMLELAAFAWLLMQESLVVLNMAICHLTTLAIVVARTE